MSSVWENLDFDHASSLSRGLLGGILCIWDRYIFSNYKIFVEVHFIIIEWIWLPMNTKLLVVSVYAPKSSVEKRIIWDHLSEVIDR